MGSDQLLFVDNTALLFDPVETLSKLLSKCPSIGGVSEKIEVQYREEGRL